MRKSSLILLLAMAFVFASVAVGFSADSPCFVRPCKSSSSELHVDRVCVPGAVDQLDCPSCEQFDFENYSGYCNVDDATTNRYIIMKICDCPDYKPDDPSWSVANAYSFKVEIQTPGVYFMPSNLSAPGCGVPGCGAECCDTDTYDATAGFFVSVLDAGNDDWFGADADEDGIANGCESFCDATTSATRFNLAYTPVSTDEGLVSTCTGLTDDKPTRVIRTSRARFFLSHPERPYLMLDLPSFIWDKGAVADGTEVIIKITLVGHGNPDGTACDEEGTICPDCKELCSCVEKIAIIGCEKNASECVLCFPYFTATGVTTWWSGMALTNYASNPVNLQITFYAGGEKVTFAESVDANSVLLKTLSEYDLDSLPADKAVYATVLATADDGGSALVDGFGIMGDSVGAYGYKAGSGSVNQLTGNIICGACLSH